MTESNLTPIGYIYILHSECYDNKIKLGSTMTISRRKFDYYNYVPYKPYYVTYFGILEYKALYNGTEYIPTEKYKQASGLVSPVYKKLLTKTLLNTECTIYKNPWFEERKHIDELHEQEFYELDIPKYGLSIPKHNEDNTIFDNAIKPYVKNMCAVLNKLGIKFTVIPEDNFTHRPKRKGKIVPRDYKKLFEKYGEEDNIIDDLVLNEDININSKYVLRPYQEEAIGLMESNNIGKFILPTGVGKTIIFLSYLSTLKKSLVLVPYLDLIYQTWEKASLFPFTKLIKICEGEVDVLELDETNPDDRVLYIATYQSSNKKQYDEYLSEHFDCIVYDEVHYTVIQNENDNSAFQYILKNGKCDKKFFFTATSKLLKEKPKISTKSLDDIIDGEEEFSSEENGEDTNTVISMDNEEVYGKSLMHMRLDEAIEQKYLTDYNIMLWLYKDLKSDISNKLKCIPKILTETCGKKILIYCNTTKMVNRVHTYISNYITENSLNIYCQSVIGETSKKDREDILHKFDVSETSILVLCKVFMVGFDNKGIDTIIHFSKCTSGIEFAQKNGRSLRLCSGKNMSNIVILTGIDDNDRDIKYYKSMLNFMGEYDYRIKGKLESMKKDGENKIYNTISIEYNDEDMGDIYTIYDKYLNYISGYNNIMKKIEILIE